MKIIFMGTPDFSVGTLEALIAAGHEIPLVVSQPDKPKGRGHELQPTPVKEAALKHGLTVYQPKKVRDPEVIEKLRETEADVIVVIAFGQIIPKSILEMKQYGCINVHASLLPKYRGAAPIQWAVIDGEKESGVTIMQMDEGLDTGDMLLKGSLELAADETGGSLFDTVKRAWRKALRGSAGEDGKGRIKARETGGKPDGIRADADQGHGGSQLDPERGEAGTADPGPEPVAQRLYKAGRQDPENLVCAGL